MTGKLRVAVMDREPDELRGHRGSGFKALFAGGLQQDEGDAVLQCGPVKLLKSSWLFGGTWWVTGSSRLYVKGDIHISNYNNVML